MTINVIGVITGAAAPGFTAPTYTLTADMAPDLRSKQSYVSTLGGTQVGVVAHSVAAPFTATARRSSVIKTIGNAVLNGVTGQYSKVPFNEMVILVRKAAQVALNQWQVNDYRYVGKVFAGTETYDSPNVYAGVSLLAGLVWSNASGICDSHRTAVLG